MRAARRFRLLLIVITLANAASPVIAQGQDDACEHPDDCRRLALEAAQGRRYESFHDLAWRVVQTGPKSDPESMYLLARAQSLSGRPHDAVVMLRRLAEMGVAAVDARTNPDFERVRALPAWAELEAALVRVAATGRTMPASDDPPRGASDDAIPSPAAGPSSVTLPAGSEPPVSAEVTAVPAVPPAAGFARTDELHFADAALSPVGLAYDAVSGRFVVGDRRSEGLKVIDERSHHVTDFVGASSAGFYQPMALELDPRRGDLWVVSAEAAVGGSSSTALHKLQLISGRLLYSVAVPAEAGSARLVDVAIANDGTVYALDSIGTRVFRLRPGARSLDLAASLGVASPSSLAPARGSVLYVAHEAGVARIDLRSGARSEVRLPDGTVGRIRWLRWRDNSLLAIQEGPEGRRRTVRLRLNRDGGSVTALDVIDDAPSEAATLAGSALYYVVRDPEQGGRHTVRRVPLP